MKDTPNASKSDHQEEEAKTSDKGQVRTNSSVPAKVADSAPVIAAVTTNPDPLKDKSLFGFAVVKRSNATAVGKKPHVDTGLAKDAPPADAAQPIRKIVDVSETASP